MTIELGKHKIELFDSLDDMGITRWNAFNKYVLIDAEIGSNIFDYDRVMKKCHTYLSKEMIAEAQQELLNTRQLIHNILQGNNVKQLSFAVLVKSIDGEKTDDFETSALNKLLTKLEGWGLNNGTVHEYTDSVKKK